jgi:hypothetical protein
MPTLSESARVSIPDAAYWTRCRDCGVLIAATPAAEALCWSCDAALSTPYGVPAAEVAVALTTTVLRGAR